jgi:hypothetical protein
MFTLTILIGGTLLSSAILAGWPLVWSRALRPAVQGVGGTFFLVAGGGAFFVLASGLIGSGSDAAYAQASDSIGDAAAKSNDETAFFTKAEASPLHTPIQTSVDDVKIIGNAPAWVGSEPVREGSIHTTAVSSDPYTTELEAEKALDAELEKQTDDYVEWVLGSKLAPKFIHYKADDIKRELVPADKTYADKVESPTVGLVHRRHALLEFKPEFRDRLKHEWNEIKAKWRLAQFGLVAGGAILFLATVFGYFRLDTATRGYYTGRLQFLSAAAILAIVGAGAVLARWIAWL